VGLDPVAAAQAYAALVLVAAGVLDAVYREIDPELWLAALPAAAPLGAAVALESPDWRLYYGLSALIVAVVAALYWLGYMGGGDVGAAAVLAVALPYSPSSILPPLYAAVIYSAPIYLAWMAWTLARECGFPCVARARARFTGRRLAARDWWSPAGLGEPVGDAHEVVAEAGAWDRELEAAPLAPWVSLLAAGYLAFLALGDPLLLLAG